MTDWLAPLLATLVPVLGRALLHFVWQGALIGLLAAIVLQLLRDARPQVRYAIACVAMLALVLVPAIDVLLQLRGTAPAVGVLADSRVIAGLALPAVDVAAWQFDADGWRVPEGMFPLIVALWAAGASVLSLRMGMGVVWIRRLQSTPQGPAHAVWQARLDALADRFGLVKPIGLRLVGTLDTPASAGWWRPVVLLPSALVTRMPVELIEALLAHELAHIRRHDYLVNLLQGVVEALLFYHPVTWWLSRRIRREREHIADQLAAAVIGTPHRLALALSELSDLRAQSQLHTAQPHDAVPHLAQAALATHGGHLMSRIQHLIQPGKRTTGGKLVFPMLGLAAACFALYAQAQVATPQPSAAASPAAAAAAPAPVIVKRVITVAALANGPTQPGKPVVTEVRRLKSDESKNAFALVRKGSSGYSMSGSDDDMDAVKAARSSIDGDFLWFRRGDQAYVVVDPTTVARAQAAWSKAETMGPQMGALGKEMELHGKKLEALGNRMEKRIVIHRPSPEMEAAAGRMGPLGDKMQKLAGEQARLATANAGTSDARDEAADARMEALSAEMEAVTREMQPHIAILEEQSKRLEVDAKPIEELSRQMEAASKPMKVMSMKMEVLGKEHHQHVKAAEQELQKVISTAVAQGLAKPAPAGTGKP